MQQESMQHVAVERQECKVNKCDKVLFRNFIPAAHKL